MFETAGGAGSLRPPMPLYTYYCIVCFTWFCSSRVTTGQCALAVSALRSGNC